MNNVMIHRSTNHVSTNPVVKIPILHRFFGCIGGRYMITTMDISHERYLSVVLTIFFNFPSKFDMRVMVMGWM